MRACEHGFQWGKVSGVLCFVVKKQQMSPHPPLKDADSTVIRICSERRYQDLRHIHHSRSRQPYRRFRCRRGLHRE